MWAAAEEARELASMLSHVPLLADLSRHDMGALLQSSTRLQVPASTPPLRLRLQRVLFPTAIDHRGSGSRRTRVRFCFVPGIVSPTFSFCGLPLSLSLFLSLSLSLTHTPSPTFLPPHLLLYFCCAVYARVRARVRMRARTCTPFRVGREPWAVSHKEPPASAVGGVRAFCASCGACACAYMCACECACVCVCARGCVLCVRVPAAPSPPPGAALVGGRPPAQI